MCCTDEIITQPGPTDNILNPSPTSTLQHVPNYNPDPTNPTLAQMYIYVPKSLASPPPIIVAIHYCTGTAQAYFTNTRWASLADKHGFIVIYPGSPHEGTCWDVSSPQTLTHNGGSDSYAISLMITHTKALYPSTDVYVTGTSSGGMMTQVLAMTYPNLFLAGAPFCGVPAGGFAGDGIAKWNPDCAEGRIIKSPTEWADIVRAAHPTYTGRRPRMQIWHGEEDEIIHYNNFKESFKQWTAVLGVSQTPTKVVKDDPSVGYTRTVYGEVVEGFSGAGVLHNIPVNEDEVMRFFGLDTLTPATTIGL
ncbi:hypothetical protein HDV00_009414 [Rhizophlyctis rosea]|nr:hypothetical protein HDV00_009414 [Rhizophlyctis rosea]